MKTEAVSVLKRRKSKKIENEVNKVFSKKGMKGKKRRIEKSLSSIKPRGPKPSVQNINVGNNFKGLSNIQLKSVGEKNKSKEYSEVQKSSKLKNAGIIEDKMAAAPVPEDRENSAARGPKNKRTKSQVVLDEASVVRKKAKAQSKIEPAVVATIEKPKISREKKKVKHDSEKEAKRVKQEVTTEKQTISSKSEKKYLQSKITLAVDTTMIKSKVAKEKKNDALTTEKVKLAFPKDERKVTRKIEKESTEVKSAIMEKSQNKKSKKSYQKLIKDSGDLKLTKQHILSSIKAIKKLTQKKLNAKTSLLPTDNHPIYLQVTSIKVPKTPRRQIRPILPHPIVGPTDDVALFVADLRKRDFEKTVEHWEEKFREKGVECIKQIIPLNQVKTEYSQFEMKRKLAMAFDHFLADGRVVGHLAHLLGKCFFKRHNRPTSVRLSSSNLKKELDTALHKTCMVVHSYGDCHTVQVGTISMKSPKLTDNVLAICSSLAAEYPGGWLNIRALHIKSQISPSIPIYMNLVSKNHIPVPVVKPKRPRAYETVEGELTTVGGGHATVTVTPEGRVTVKREKREIKKETEDEEKVKMEKTANSDDEDDAEAESEDEDGDNDDSEDESEDEDEDGDNDNEDESEDENEDGDNDDENGDQ